MKHTLHTLDLSAETLYGYFSAERAPVISIDPGDSVRFPTLDATWTAGPDDLDSRHPLWQEGYKHALVGPIAVRGARPGMTLAVRIVDVVPGPWGQTPGGGWPSAYNRRYGVESGGVRHEWSLDTTTMTGRNQHGHTVALRPFLGVLGMPPPEPGNHSTTPPRPYGGNLDCKELVAGSTLFLPIPVEDALFSAGDGHAAQGDGEVSGAAIECPMQRVELGFDLHDDFPVTGPVAHTPAGWLTIGLGDSLDEAAYAALDAMFDLLGRLHGLSRPDAVALASVVVDLRVTQIVNQVVGVHAVLPRGAIR